MILYVVCCILNYYMSYIIYQVYVIYYRLYIINNMLDIIYYILIIIYYMLYSCKIMKSCCPQPTVAARVLIEQEADWTDGKTSGEENTWRFRPKPRIQILDDIGIYWSSFFIIISGYLRYATTKTPKMCWNHQMWSQANWIPESLPPSKLRPVEARSRAPDKPS
jgi:hypothetical protein